MLDGIKNYLTSIPSEVVLFMIGRSLLFSVLFLLGYLVLIVTVRPRHTILRVMRDEDAAIARRAELVATLSKYEGKARAAKEHIVGVEFST